MALVSHMRTIGGRHLLCKKPFGARRCDERVPKVSMTWRRIGRVATGRHKKVRPAPVNGLRIHRPGPRTSAATMRASSRRWRTSADRQGRISSARRSTSPDRDSGIAATARRALRTLATTTSVFEKRARRTSATCRAARRSLAPEVSMGARRDAHASRKRPGPLAPAPSPPPPAESLTRASARPRLRVILDPRP